MLVLVPIKKIEILQFPMKQKFQVLRHTCQFHIDHNHPCCAEVTAIWLGGSLPMCIASVSSGHCYRWEREKQVEVLVVSKELSTGFYDV